jgi:hypothetical protein
MLFLGIDWGERHHDLCLLGQDGSVLATRRIADGLADLVRTDRHNHRPVAGDTPLAEAVKVLARAHQGLIWTRQRHANGRARRHASIALDRGHGRDAGRLSCSLIAVSAAHRCSPGCLVGRRLAVSVGWRRAILLT